jgi:hypothetical protein
MTTARSVLDNIRRRYRDWRAARRAAFELQCVGAAEVERVAQELGLSSSALQSLVTRPMDGNCWPSVWRVYTSTQTHYLGRHSGICTGFARCADPNIDALATSP